jgi:hypothetical protein
MAAGLPVSARSQTAWRQAAVTSRCPLRVGRNPWTETNPGRGCGMKQAREAGGGESRRGAEKARGRNEVGPGNPACPCPDTESWTPPVMSR